MKYNFDKFTERRSTNSLKWDIGENELPFWVADMDLPTAPEVIRAMRERLDNGVFGYSVVPDEWYSSIQNWWKNRHNLLIEKEQLIFCTGVVPAISSIVRKLTTPAENVLILTPVYNIFFNSIRNNGRNIVECPLVQNGDGGYEIDLTLLDKKLSDPQTTMMIFCDPHNPVGKIWDKQTLAAVGEIASKHDVIIVSDEIHCDLTDPGKEYVPFASVWDKKLITCISPTKSFNIAGLQTAAVFVRDKTLRHKVWRALNTDEVAEPNAFAITAAVAAYRHGGQWLDELREYLFENKRMVKDFIEKNIARIKLTPAEATYLLWLDCRDVCGADDEGLQSFLREKAGVFLSNGSIYGRAGSGFLRLNIACPRSMLKEGLERLKNGIEEYSKKTPSE